MSTVYYKKNLFKSQLAEDKWTRKLVRINEFTQKFDNHIYSYGMMLLEMVGGRKNIDAEAIHTSEIYFPYWVYNRLEKGADLRPDGLITMKKKMR